MNTTFDLTELDPDSGDPFAGKVKVLVPISIASRFERYVDHRDEFRLTFRGLRTLLYVEPTGLNDVLELLREIAFSGTRPQRRAAAAGLRQMPSLPAHLHAYPVATTPPTSWPFAA